MAQLEPSAEFRGRRGGTQRYIYRLPARTKSRNKYAILLSGGTKVQSRACGSEIIGNSVGNFFSFSLYRHSQIQVTQRTVIGHPALVERENLRYSVLGVLAVISATCYSWTPTQPATQR